MQYGKRGAQHKPEVILVHVNLGSAQPEILSIEHNKIWFNNDSDGEVDPYATSNNQVAIINLVTKLIFEDKYLP